MFLNRLLFTRPEPKITVGTRCKLVRDWIVRETLNSVIVGILEDSLKFTRPDDDTFICASRCKSNLDRTQVKCYYVLAVFVCRFAALDLPFAILGICNAVNVVFVTL